jgi:hypothetical protein
VLSFAIYHHGPYESLIYTNHSGKTRLKTRLREETRRAWKERETKTRIEKSVAYRADSAETLMRCDSQQKHALTHSTTLCRCKGAKKRKRLKSGARQALL